MNIHLNICIAWMSGGTDDIMFYLIFDEFLHKVNILAHEFKYSFCGKIKGENEN